MAHTITHVALATLLGAGSLRLLIAVWVHLRPALHPRVAWDPAPGSADPAA